MSVRKKKATKVAAYSLAKPIAKGTTITDGFKRNWIIGVSIGQGGFGCIYSAKLEGDNQEKYVAKIEPQENGPLFTEIHFYIRACNQDSLRDWKSKHHLRFLGVPRYVGSGLFTPPGQSRCRFLIMDRFTSDLESALNQKKLSAAGAVRVASHVLDALEYIHSRDYAHADIKASNLLYESNIEEVTLVDFGLVYLYRMNGTHCPAKSDPKFQHNGTLEFCSRDAHRGFPPSRRGDLEILFFNLVHWLARCQPNATQSHSTGLPWGNLISDPKLRQNVPNSVKAQVAAIKEQSVNDLTKLTSQTGLCENSDLLRFARSITQLKYDESPDYASLRHQLTLLHKFLLSKDAKSRSPAAHTVVKRASTERIPTAVEALANNSQQTNVKAELPVKRPRGRANAAPAVTATRKPKVSTKKPVGATKRPTSPVYSLPQSPANNFPPQNHTVSPDLFDETPTRTAQLKTVTVLKRTPLTTPTRSSPRLHAAARTPYSLAPSPGSINRVQQFREIFTDSEEEPGAISSGKEYPVKSYPEPSGRKVLSPCNPYRERVDKLHKMIDRRRSACCQTSPELLVLAKAEALGRKAADMANRHIR